MKQTDEHPSSQIATFDAALYSDEEFSSQEKPEGAVFEAEDDSEEYAHPHTGKIQRIRF